VLVFTRTKHLANRLSQQLEQDGLSAAAIHGNKSQGARTRALADFKKGDIRVLVATDIAARGLDIEQLPHVVNYELPNVPEDYVHRIGRTGRAGAAGHAISLVDGEEINLVTAIERLIQRRIDRATAVGFVPSAGSEAAHDADHRREPMPRRGGGGGRQGQGQSRHATVGAPRGDRPAGGRGPAPGKPAGRPQSRPRGEVDGNRAPRTGEPREADGNRNVNGNRPDVDGNRISNTSRPDADGNRLANNRRPEADGNRAGQGQNRRPAPRAALFAAKPGNGNR
jgi:ATP-dependent RNA helicase RhlE